MRYILAAILIGLTGCYSYEPSTRIEQIAAGPQMIQVVCARGSVARTFECSGAPRRVGQRYTIYRFRNGDYADKTVLEPFEVVDASKGLFPITLDGGKRVDFWMSDSDHVVRCVSEARTNEFNRRVAVLGHSKGSWRVLREWRFRDPPSGRSVISSMDGRYLLFTRDGSVLDTQSMEIRVMPDIEKKIVDDHREYSHWADFFERTYEFNDGIVGDGAIYPIDLGQSYMWKVDEHQLVGAPPWAGSLPGMPVQVKGPSGKEMLVMLKLPCDVLHSPGNQPKCVNQSDRSARP